MKEISEKSKQIIELINQGKMQFEIRKLGYNVNTVRYYWTKLKNPNQFQKNMVKIQEYNKKRMTQ